MRCSACGLEEAVMKTVYRPADGDDAEWPLCEGCYEAVKNEVLIIPGQSYAFGWCRSCQGWYSLNDLREWAGGGLRGAPTGTCVACAGMPE